MDSGICGSIGLHLDCGDGCTNLHMGQNDTELHTCIVTHTSFGIRV